MTGGGRQNGRPPNLAISSQMMIKLGKDVLCTMGRNLYKLTKIFDELSSC